MRWREVRGDSTRLSSLGRAPDGPSLWDDERQRLAIRRVVLFLVLCLVASMVVIVPSSVPAAAAPTTPRICSSETVSGDLPAWGVGSIGWTTLGDIWVPQGATLTMQGSVAVNSRSISGWSANVYFRPNSGNRHLSGSGPNTYAVGGSWTNSGASRERQGRDWSPGRRWQQLQPDVHREHRAIRTRLHAW